MGFSSRQLKTKWAHIPDDTDVLVTHMPPLALHDLACARRYDDSGVACEVCGGIHPEFRHWGCAHLLNTVRALVVSNRVRGSVSQHNTGCAKGAPAAAPVRACARTQRRDVPLWHAVRQLGDGHAADGACDRCSSHETRQTHTESTTAGTRRRVCKYLAIAATTRWQLDLQRGPSAHRYRSCRQRSYYCSLHSHAVAGQAYLVAGRPAC